MAVERYLPLPNQRVEIEVREPNHADLYLTRIEDVGARIITVVCPMRDGEVVPLREGIGLTVTYTRERALFCFDTRVVERVPGEVPRLRLDMPDEILRVQRRDHLRMAARFPVKYSVVEADLTGARGGEWMQDAECVDISAGGMRIRPLHVVPGIAVGSYVRVRFLLPGTSEGFDLLGQVMRIERCSVAGGFDSVAVDETPTPSSIIDEIIDPKGLYRIAIRFVGISLRTQDLITKFVFDRERELIERGVAGH